jgi:hypothetical protein
MKHVPLEGYTTAWDVLPWVRSPKDTRWPLKLLNFFIFGETLNFQGLPTLVDSRQAFEKEDDLRLKKGIVFTLGQVL